MQRDSADEVLGAGNKDGRIRFQEQQQPHPPVSEKTDNELPAHRPALGRKGHSCPLLQLEACLKENKTQKRQTYLYTRSYFRDIRRMGNRNINRRKELENDGDNKGGLGKEEKDTK